MHGFFPSSFAVKTIQITKMLNITSEDDTWNWVGRTVWHPGGRVEKVDANAHATNSCSTCLWAGIAPELIVSVFVGWSGLFCN